MPAILYALRKIVKKFNTIEYSGGTVCELNLRSACLVLYLPVIASAKVSFEVQSWDRAYTRLTYNSLCSLTQT